MSSLSNLISFCKDNREESIDFKNNHEHSSYEIRFKQESELAKSPNSSIVLLEK
jgi:hypothetical protein